MMSIDEAFNIIELEDKNIIKKLQQAKDYNSACKAIEELQIILKKQKRILAKKYHPDIGGDEEKYKEINSTLDKLFEIKAQRVEQIPTFTVVIRTNYESYTTGADTWTWNPF